MVFLGMDIGAVSVKTARLSTDGTLLDYAYRRHYGRPLETARQMLAEALAQHDDIAGLGFTGSGGKHVAALLGVPFENDLVAQARAAAHLTPQARSVIVIGGETSFLLLLDEGGSAERVRIRDFAMNSLCAAGCGCFLDQQASRLGVNIEEEFGASAVASKRPARVAGRCSVFAKTDMIHLQQKATPVEDIVGGLCFSFARNFTAVLARGKELQPPLAFHGGVAANAGMVRAFREMLNLSEEEFLVPDHAAAAGAVGAALLARQTGAWTAPPDLSALTGTVVPSRLDAPAYPPLPDPGPPPPSRLASVPEGPPIDAYLGVDVGSISTNVVLIDDEKRVLAKVYLMTAGRPIEAVRQGLEIVGTEWAGRVTVRGVCTTGSGRYLTGDFLGADLVKNEITAQARAAAEIDPRVDTIFEIGGQDSKYISLEDGAIVDFEMNKVCAAGTGSFLEEQAERLGVSIKGEFADLAFTSQAPVRLGERCTVFMESDLAGHQSRGAATPDLAAGLAYSIVYNYLNRVVAERKVGERIFFQGGTAFNRAVVAAFQQVTGKPVTVPEHHEVTGAIGCALMAREHAQPGVPSHFKGWDVWKRQYKMDSFECKGCANCCEINRVVMEGEQPLFYGGRCEKYEKRKSAGEDIPDLFAEREKLLLQEYREGQAAPGAPLIGIPRTLHFAEYLPFWTAFFNALGVPVKLSNPTTRTAVNRGVEATMAEFCFPIKVSHGHTLELMEAGVTHLFLPCVVSLPRPNKGYNESVPCPFVTGLPYTLRAALAPEEHGVQILAPIVDLDDRSARTVKRLQEALQPLNLPRKAITAALNAAYAAQTTFWESLQRRGREVLDGLGPDDRAVVLVSRPYNGCDNGINLELPGRFRELGTLPIPMDMLPVDDFDLSSEIPDLTWRYGQKILGAAELIRRDPRLAAVYLTNFGCGPDSFLLRFFRARMGGKTFLQIEVDEHSSDVGALTRCEAFLDSLHKLTGGEREARRFRVNAIPGERRTIYIPYMCDSAHAVAAAFRSVGAAAEVLPESTDESVAIGKRFCTGKECFPCLVTTGDMVRQLSQPGFDVNTAAFFIPTATGGCRFGYYNILQRLVLDELGHLDVPIFSPNQNRGLYDTLGARAGDTFVRRAWQGMVAIELLEKALHSTRPRETMPGAAEELYRKYLNVVIKAIEEGSDLEPVMYAARTEFERLSLGQDGRPWVGIVGEIYVRLHRFSNRDLIRRIEELGGQVWMSPISEWLFYINLLQKEDAHHDGKWGELMRLHLTDHVMKSDERRLVAAWEGFTPILHEPSPEEMIKHGQRYMDPAFRGEAIVSLGKAAYLHEHGLAGVINVMPFTCMPGTVASGMLKRFQQEHDNMPVLNLAFDGQSGGDLPLRLEAFMQQCHSYLERRNGNGGVSSEQ